MSRSVLGPKSPSHPIRIEGDERNPSPDVIEWRPAQQPRHASLRSARGVDGGNDDGSVVLQIEQINPVDGVAGYVRRVLCAAWSLLLSAAWMFVPVHERGDFRL